MRIVIVVMLLAVVYNMGRALIFIFRDQGHERERGVRALTLRVALSFALVVLLVVVVLIGCGVLAILADVAGLLATLGFSFSANAFKTSHDISFS